jgi:mono/diheme cytochrome c family protein
MSTNIIKVFVLGLTASLLLASCHAGKNDPGRVYAPDMVYSQAYEPYVKSEVFESGMAALLPPEGAVAYGYSETADPIATPWPFPNWKDTLGKMASVHAFKNPVTPTPVGLEEGEHLYRVYCGICHGGEMDGKGYLVTGTPYGQVPANLMEDRFLDVSEGYLYHIMQYGYNAMGSYAYAMTREQRWMVTTYIKQKQKDYVAEVAREAAQAAADATDSAE